MVEEHKKIIDKFLDEKVYRYNTRYLIWLDVDDLTLQLNSTSVDGNKYQSEDIFVLSMAFLHNTPYQKTVINYVRDGMLSRLIKRLNIDKEELMCIPFYNEMLQGFGMDALGTYIIPIEDISSVEFSHQKDNTILHFNGDVTALTYTDSFEQYYNSCSEKISHLLDLRFNLRKIFKERGE